MGKQLNNEKGLTLLEVLLSIVLLVIVLTTFANFFSQSAMFVKKNEEKFSSTQTAQQVINLIEQELTKSELENSSKCQSLSCTLNNEELSILLDSTIESPFFISAIFTNSVEGLVQVKVSVTDTNNTENFSETFTYIRR